MEYGFWDAIKDKTVVLYGADLTGMAIKNQAEQHDIDISYYVDSNEEKHGSYMMGKLIKSPFDLIYEDREKLVVIITAAYKEQIINTLVDIGLDPKRNIITDVIDSRIHLDNIDALVGVSRSGQTMMDMRLKRSKEEKIVLCLGGSTTDPTYEGRKSWPAFLQEIIDEHGWPWRVVNGGMIGYSSSEQLLIFLREGIDLNPNMVLELSGYNDYSPSDDLPGGRYRYTCKYLHDTLVNFSRMYSREHSVPPLYFGELINDKFDIYIRNVRLMHAICSSFGMMFLELFQPNVFHLKYWNRFCTDLVNEPYVKRLKENEESFANKIHIKKNSFPYIIDLTNALSMHPEVFIDVVHVNEEGNRIIANSVFDIIKNMLINI